MKKENSNIVSTTIEQQIFVIRGKKVMFDSDLAKLYGVKTKELNLAVKRNLFRFPTDFRFQLNSEELTSLRFQIETSKKGKGGRRYLPYVFTEQGVAMLSGVLNSQRAVLVNIEIMRTFTKLREMIISHKDLQKKIEEMEKKYDEKFSIVFKTLRELLTLPFKEKPKKQIGFQGKNT